MDKNTTEIEKLTERIAKDPKSKLFVPLAEEYKKAGDIEMAVKVLADGLRSNPGYVTARSFLGRLLLEKGDLSGAQKELEEVIKAIPDNLLAQRKLGDIYVLQGKGRDALPRYKAALALNPGDKELPALLADLEAGRDVSSRIPGPKAAAKAAVPTASPSKPVPAAVKPPVAAPAAPAAAQKAPFVASKTAPVTTAPTIAAAAATPSPVPAAAPKAAAVPSAPVLPKTDAAPVAPVSPKPEVKPAAPAAAASVRPEQSATLPAATQAPDEVEVIEDIVEIEQLEKHAEVRPEPEASVQNAPAPVAAETPAFDLSDLQGAAPAGAGDIADVSWGSDTFSVPPLPPEVEAAAVPEEGSDDLNTNTLAELYISQGFYDKALEVYQGMLGERPDNKALQEKIEKLRALTDTAAVSAGGFSTPVAEPAAVVPPAAEAGIEARSVAEVSEAVPVETPVMVSASPAPEGAPMVEAVQERAGTAVETEKPASRAPRAASLRRKETIDRLESWLSNIMKEKKS